MDCSDVRLFLAFLERSWWATALSLHTFGEVLAIKVRLHHIILHLSLPTSLYLFTFTVLRLHHKNKVSNILILASGSAFYRTWIQTFFFFFSIPHYLIARIEKYCSWERPEFPSLQEYHMGWGFSWYCFLLLIFQNKLRIKFKTPSLHSFFSPFPIHSLSWSSSINSYKWFDMLSYRSVFHK